jgi:hypothetical protein
VDAVQARARAGTPISNRGGHVLFASTSWALCRSLESGGEPIASSLTARSRPPAPGCAHQELHSGETCRSDRRLPSGSTAVARRP